MSIIIISENKLRRIVHEELDKLISPTESPPSMTHITSSSGGEIIMPNYAKEMFDKGKVKSFKDLV